MPSFEGLFLGALLVLLALGALGLFATLRRSAASPATDALGRGQFATALARAATGPGARREEILAAAVAAKHLLALDRAAALLDRLLAEDPQDGEAWAERGLVAAYAALAAAPAPRPASALAPAADAFARAADAFLRALACRSDLAESINLHRAWLALCQGDRGAARRLFDEVEAPLETKLRSDLGAGEPLFAEWFLQAGALWEAFGEPEKALWARRAGREAAAESLLPGLLAGPARPLSVPEDGDAG